MEEIIKRLKQLNFSQSRLKKNSFCCFLALCLNNYIDTLKESCLIITSGGIKSRKTIILHLIRIWCIFMLINHKVLEITEDLICLILLHFCAVSVTLCVSSCCFLLRSGCWLGTSLRRLRASLKALIWFPGTKTSTSSDRYAVLFENVKCLHKRTCRLVGCFTLWV